MDEGSAAVIAAAFGIAGTLLGSLGGALVAARSARKQVRDQEGAEHRNWLRQERQKAYGALIDACYRTRDALLAIRRARMAGDGSPPRHDVANPLVQEHLASIQAATSVVALIALVGPEQMYRQANRTVTQLQGIGVELFQEREDWFAENTSAMQQFSGQLSAFTQDAHAVIAGDADAAL
ncbi:hypothetical protein [Actinacidiphila glaucinigra]|uniref:hypothetical protein n=1 Tax=Actinacidiphila glaucinigra TaxID=235986 RepID=UPI00117E4584|nr:hypothetical protein [Actinacidiphila glaucinigra]